MFTVRNFLKAADRGDTASVAAYLAGPEAAECLAGRDGEGNTALHLAARNAHVETVEALIRGGCDVAARNKGEYTPLALAVTKNAAEVVPALIAAGADVNASVGEAHTALSLALLRYNYKSEIADMLLDAKADPNKGQPLIQALEHSDWPLAEKLLALGADPGTLGANRYRPVHYAAQNGAHGLMKTLLEKGADINAREYYGNTPLLLAIGQGDAKMVEMLLEKGARIDIVNSHSSDALAAARANRNAPDVLALVYARYRKELEKTTTPLNATAEALPAGDAETWVLMGEQKVARVSVHPLLVRRLTEVFNFESRERMIISENLKNQAESITPPVPFDETPVPLLKKAFEALRNLGGETDEEAVFGTRMPKKTLKP